MLGKMHSEKTYKTVFLFHVRTDVIQSVYVLSKDDATEEAMDAWINQIAFVMKYMIVPLVESQIEETDLLKEPTVGFKILDFQ
jgi:hypothetical protein